MIPHEKRYVYVKNVGTSPIDVYIESNGKRKLGTILPQHAIKWSIPDEHWKGNFRVGQSINATRAEFSFNKRVNNLETIDTYDISTVPPSKNHTIC